MPTNLKQNESRNVSEELARLLSPSSVVRIHEPMSLHTSWGVGGPADVFILPGTFEDVLAVVSYCRDHGVCLTVLGNGTNILVRDGGIRGVVMQFGGSKLDEIIVSGRKIRCEAGAKLPRLCRVAAEHGLSGLEFAEGIPGTIGGAVRMNAGAFGGSIFDRIVKIDFVTRGGEVGSTEAGQVEIAYRSCPFFADKVICRVELECQEDSPQVIMGRIEEYRQRRRTSQPNGLSAGCVFKNPLGMPAGKLIEDVGLKGLRVGGAVISSIHANFILNEGAATASDILRLIEIVQQRVLSATGTRLELEIEVLGHD